MCDAPVLQKSQTFAPSESTSKVCDYCEMAVEYLEYALDSDMTSDQMKAGLEALCDQIQPPSLAGQCVAFVEKNWDRIVEDIDMVLDHPDQVCQKLHMCKKQKMLGGPGCTFGPSYWCKNADTMKECDVPEDYCKKKTQAPPMPDECTYGPAYWCKDEETIKKCDAEDFCKKKSEKLESCSRNEKLKQNLLQDIVIVKMLAVWSLSDNSFSIQNIVIYTNQNSSIFYQNQKRR